MIITNRYSSVNTKPEAGVIGLGYGHPASGLNGVTFSQPRSSTFRVTFSPAVDPQSGSNSWLLAPEAPCLKEKGCSWKYPHRADQREVPFGLFPN